MSRSCDGQLRKESKSHNADPEGGGGWIDPIDLNVTANWFRVSRCQTQMKWIRGLLGPVAQSRTRD